MEPNILGMEPWEFIKRLFGRLFDNDDHVVSKSKQRTLKRNVDSCCTTATEESSFDVYSSSSASARSKSVPAGNSGSSCSSANDLVVRDNDDHGNLIFQEAFGEDNKNHARRYYDDDDDIDSLQRTKATTTPIYKKEQEQLDSSSILVTPTLTAPRDIERSGFSIKDQTASLLLQDQAADEQQFDRMRYDIATHRMYTRIINARYIKQQEEEKLLRGYHA